MVTRRFHARLLVALASVLFCAASTLANAADTEPFRLTLSGSFQADRLNSPLADSLRMTMTHANRATLAFDFRVAEFPLRLAARPALHVVGSALTTRHAVAVLGTQGSGSTPATLAEIPVIEMNTGFVLTLPMAIIDPGAGAQLYAGYHGGLVLAGGKAQDFLRLKQVVFGFERTRGLFQGSLAEMAYGHNETWGLDFASKRWAARFRIQSLLGPASAPPSTARPVAGKAAPVAVPSMGSPLRAFVELGADTDGGRTDAIQAQLGLTLDAGSVLQRVMGSPR